MDSHDYLVPEARALLDSSPAYRANRMLAERFIKHERINPILDHIRFLRFRPQQSRASGLVVTGKPGSGKTMLAKSVLREFPASPATATDAASRPVIMISMTGAREAKILYNRLLTELGCPNESNYIGSDRERMALKLCRAARVCLLIVDEIQDILTSTPRQQRIALDTIKFLMNELSLPILVLGTPQAKIAMELDEHLNARFEYRDLPVWDRDDYLVTFLDTLESRLPLKKRSHLSSMPIMTALVKLSGGILDPIVKMVCYAAAHAVEAGSEQITLELIERARREPPVAATRFVEGKAA